MQNISRGSTFGDFVHYPHRGACAGQHGCKTTEYKVSDSLLPTLLIVLYCERVSLRTVKIFSICLWQIQTPISLSSMLARQGTNIELKL